MSKGNRYELSLNPSHVGRRVMIRRVTEDGPTDLVGPLVAWDGEILSVGTLDGSTLSVPYDALVAGKVVPPAPRYRRPVAPPGETSDEELERIALLGWRAVEAQWRDGWLLRAGRGFTGRANSALALTTPGPDLETIVDWYGARGLPAQLQVPLPLAATLDARLEAAGWRAHNATWVMTAQVDVLAERLDEAVRVDEAPDEGWLASYHYRGGELPEVGKTLLMAAQTPGFASIRDRSGEVLAIGRGACDMGWVGLTAIEVSPTFRRQGLGARVVEGLAEWAQRRGAKYCYLQVAQSNVGAIALYGSLGFEIHHSYVYRVLDG